MSRMLPIRDWSLCEVQKRLGEGTLTSVSLTEACLAQAEEAAPWNPMIRVMRDEALAAAHRADRASERGDSLGRLHGVPFTVKDLIWSAGIETTSGSEIDRHFVPSKDADVLARLKSAGGVLLGKTNMHEFAYGVTNENPHYGDVHNPWDPTRVSGGSSGGSAVALAAGAGFGSVGTDTGGSIRVPASLCGVVGLKPTYGLVSCEGVTPLSWSLDHVGPMARSVEDLAVFFEVMAGVGGASLATKPETADSPWRIGVFREPFFDGLDPEVSDSVESLLRALPGRLPARLGDVSLPETVIAIQADVRNTIAYAEAASYHAQHLIETPERFAPSTLELLRLGELVPATDYIAALRRRREVVDAYGELFESIDVLITPMTPAPAPELGAETLDTGENVRGGLLRLGGPFNLNGLPALSVPCGFTSNGLPIGVQVVAGAFRESQLLRFGRVIEELREETHGPIRWPALPTAPPG